MSPGRLKSNRRSARLTINASEWSACQIDVPELFVDAGGAHDHAGGGHDEMIAVHLPTR
jgi:hypothetical protein